MVYLEGIFNFNVCMGLGVFFIAYYIFLFEINHAALDPYEINS